MNIIQRLNTFMAYTGLSSSQFADKAGVPRPSMSQLLNGRNKKVSNEIIEKLHTAFPSLNVVWLMFGEGPMETTVNTRISEPQNGGISEETTAQSSSAQQNTSADLQFENATENSQNRKSQSSDPRMPPRMASSASSAPASLFDAVSEQPSAPRPYPTTVPAGETPTLAAEHEEPAQYGKFDPVSPVASPSGAYGVTVLCSSPQQASAASNGAATAKSPAQPSQGAEPQRAPERRIASIMVIYTDNSIQIFKSEGTPEISH